MKQDIFETQYRGLNPAQRQAVDTIEGPVMVIAGPGTGKTQILTLRIAQILLKTQVNPSNILALTFTTAAATNMRERLMKVVGNAAYLTHIFTFHSFCSRIIADHPDDFWEVLGKRLADDVQKVEILEKILDAGVWEHIRPFGKPYHYISESMRAISDLKREGVTPAEFGQMVSEEMRLFEAIPDKESTRAKGKLKGIYQTQLKHIQKNSELAKLYECYQEKMVAADLYDYDDLIMYTLQKLTHNEDFRLRVMEQYHYILIDEHQDSNNAQNKIIRLLGSFHENPNIFVVGDEKQAIFRFQGASVENFRSFREIYPTARLITLTQNYRSTQTILDSALELLKVRETQGLRACALHKDAPLNVIDVPDYATQCEELARRIDVHIAASIPAHEIAVIVRTRAQAKQIASYLHAHEIPAYRETNENIFEDPAVSRLIKILTAVYQYGDEEAFFEALFVDLFGLPPLDVYKLSQTASRARRSIYDLLEDETVLKKLSLKEPAKMRRLSTQLAQWASQAHNTDVHTFMHIVVQESGLLKHVLQSAEGLTSIAALRTLYDVVASLDIRGDWKLRDLFDYFKKVHTHGLQVKASVALTQKGKVQIVTAHASKGLEYDHVFIPYAQENVWGGRGRAPLFKLPTKVYGAVDSDTDDDRRLFFVALTRARQTVTILHAHTDLKGDTILKTPYIDDILPELRTAYTVEKSTQNLIALSEKTHLVPSAERETYRDFVTTSLEHYGLSVSALNNYLQCPWKYFYVNLVRVPAGKNKTLLFGNAIHAALSYFFKHFKDTGEKSRDYLLQAFEHACGTELFTREEYMEVLPRGKEFLRAYFDHYESEFTRNIIVKYRIPGAQMSCGDSEVKLTGELDMVTYLDETFSKIRVTDFKTGRAKSRNEILGETKDADGNYYRQLTFYKLLLDVQNSRWDMIEGELDFIQPDSAGTWHRERFQIEPSEVNSLRTKIIEVVNEVRALQFWDRTCDDTSCEWCALRTCTHKKEFEEGLF